jgi:hypothetical protein
MKLAKIRESSKIEKEIRLAWQLAVEPEVRAVSAYRKSDREKHNRELVSDRGLISRLHETKVGRSEKGQ